MCVIVTIVADILMFGVNHGSTHAKSVCCFSGRKDAATKREQLQQRLEMLENEHASAVKEGQSSGLNHL